MYEDCILLMNPLLLDIVTHCTITPVERMIVGQCIMPEIAQNIVGRPSVLISCLM